MSWALTSQAKQENRHELILSGDDLTKNLKSCAGILDETIFDLEQLNFLRLSASPLSSLSSNIGKLVNLTNLDLQHNHLEVLPDVFTSLGKLKLLDVSNNKLKNLPISLNGLTNLATLNACGNALETVVSFKQCSLLAHLDLRMNQLENFSPICHTGLTNLSDLLLSSNLIDEIPEEIAYLSSLKSIDLIDNRIESVPGGILDCTKLKDILLKGNPLADRRFRKLVESDRCLPRQVVDYIRQNCKNNSKGKDKKKKKGKHAEEVQINLLCDRLSILSAKEDINTITITPDVKEIRNFIVCCIVRGLDLSATKMKKFIGAQAKLHDDICDKRVTATIATHDLDKVLFPLTYTAKGRGQILIQPLNRSKAVRAHAFFKSLQTEAETLRKQMKRNTYSGIHKYIHLVEPWEKWPVLEDSQGTVISFPPITNAENTKISQETTAILAEVTSSTSLPKAKEVMEALIKSIIDCEISKEKTENDRSILQVEQVRISEEDGTLRVVFPSRTDFSNAEIWNQNVQVIRG